MASKKTAAKKSSKKKAAPKKASSTKVDTKAELNELHNAAMGMITNAGRTSQLLRHPKVKQLPDCKPIIDAAGALISDLESHTTRLQGIRSRVENTISGDISDPDALINSLGLAEEYRAWMENFQAATMPLVDTINNAAELLDSLPDEAPAEDDAVKAVQKSIDEDAAKRKAERERGIAKPTGSSTDTPISTNSLMDLATGNKRRRNR